MPNGKRPRAALGAIGCYIVREKTQVNLLVRCQVDLCAVLPIHPQCFHPTSLSLPFRNPRSLNHLLRKLYEVAVSIATAVPCTAAL